MRKSAIILSRARASNPFINSTFVGLMEIGIINFREQKSVGCQYCSRGVVVKVPINLLLNYPSGIYKKKYRCMVELEEDRNILEEVLGSMGVPFNTLQFFMFNGYPFIEIEASRSVSFYS